MAGLVGAKAGDLDVVAEQIRKLGDGVDFAGEELFLIIETRPPSEVGADFEVFAEAVPHHVRRVDALGGIFVMGTPGGVDVVIARPPAHQRRVDPALHLKRLGDVRGANGEGAGLRDRLGASIIANGVGAARQFHVFAVGAVDLRVKMKVRRKPLGLRRIDAAQLVAKFKTSRGRLAVFVEHLERDLAGRLAVEQQIDLVAKAEVLRPLANVEAELGVALAGVAAVKLDDAIFECQTAERLGERLRVVHGQAKPAVADLILRRAGVGEGVRAAGTKLGGDTGLVVYLDEKTAPTLFNQLELGRTGFHLHARLRVDVDAEQALGIKDLLNSSDGIGVVRLTKRLVEAPLGLGGERFAEIILGLNESLNLRLERLKIHIMDFRK